MTAEATRTDELADLRISAWGVTRSGAAPSCARSRARRGAARVQGFYSVDPLADRADLVGTSPYAYALNDPINLVDPTGMSPESPDDDYRLNVDGSVELIRETDDDHDVLYASDLDQELTGESIEVEKGVLGAYAASGETNADLEGDSYSSVELDDNEATDELFEFVADGSTNAEVALTKSNDGKAVLSSSHIVNKEGGSQAEGYNMLKDGRGPKQMIHSHPSGGSPSQADRNNASYFKQYTGGRVRTTIYRPGPDNKRGSYEDY